MTQADFIIIGGGIAGASAGYALAPHGRVILLERESQPGYHSTGRSAAVFSTTYQFGDPLLRTLVLGSEEFLKNPPAGFAEHALLTPRQALYVCDRADPEGLEEMYAALARVTDDVAWLNERESLALVPALTPAYRTRAILEKHVMDMDVHGLHDGYLRGIRARGGTVRCDAAVTALSRTGTGWRVDTAEGGYTAPVVINAAGAWVDRVAELAGVRPIGIRPLRRTAILIDPPEGMDIAAWPFVMEARQSFYIKPDGGKLLISPMDQSPSAPCDARPEEIDTAYAAHHAERALGLAVRRIEHSWAGLRSHVADKHPVAGFAPDAPGFFWLAGQGGFGIKTAPAMARLTAALAQGQPLPEDLAARGLTEQAVSPARLFG